MTERDWPTGENDIQVLKDLRRWGPKKCHIKYYGDSPDPRGSFDSLIQRIKDRAKNYRWYINSIEALCRSSDYLKKRMIVPGNEWEVEDL